MIKIINDFFKKEDLEKVQDFALNKAFYTPSYFDHATEKTKEFYYGSRFHLRRNKELLDFFTKQSELKFKIKIKKVNDNSGMDLRNLDHFKPHTDENTPAKINILIMISGPTAVTNGTVFYTDKKLDIHVGFKENRAVMFPSDYYHSQHASKIPNLKRYTSTLFVEDYTELDV
jgi:hypothetical protein|tara:strand:+ start:4175 stop:4693 length:519 start_codon:yes stop_codon:yes gene_type:complete